jgi:hypothetical protein
MMSESMTSESDRAAAPRPGTITGVPEQIEHTPVLCGLAGNPSLPADLVDVLIRDGDAEILADLVERTDLTQAQTTALVARCDPRMIALLVRHGLADAEPRHFDDPAIAIQLIGCGLGAPEILARLAHGPDPAIRRLIADQVTPLPEEITRAFAADTDIRLVATVAGWGELPDDVARALARHPDREVRSELAANPSGTVPPDVLVELLTTGGDAPITTCGACRANPSPDERCHTHSAGLEVIRSYALRNESTPVAALLDYVDADDASDRATLAAREDLPPTLLARLADDIEDFVRATVAENPSTPADTLRTLACDTSVNVRRAVGSNPNIPLDLLFDLAVRTRLPLHIPRIDRASEHELRGIAASRSARVRALAAARPDLPEDLCATLTDDPDPGVAKHLADRPGLNADDLRLLAARHGPRLYSAIARNPNCPPELLHTMARNSQTVQKALREIAKHSAAEPRTLILCLDDREARQQAAANPAMPADALVALVESPDRRDAYTAAANPSLPVEWMRRTITGRETN